MNTTEERLTELLMEAYEAGWRGCLELKEEYANSVAEEEKEKALDYLPPLKEIPTEINLDVNTITVSSSGAAMGGEYTFELQGVEPVVLETEWRDFGVVNSVETV
jgi:hypothetical protein